MRLSAGALFLLFQAALPLFSQGVIVEVIDYIDYDEAIPSYSYDLMAGSTLNGRAGGGGGGWSTSPREVISIQEYFSERRGGNYVLPATSGCGPVVLNWNRQVSKSTVISGNAGVSYVVAVQASYGVTDTITVSTGGTFEVPKRQCGYIIGKEGLHYAEFDVLKNNKRIGSGAILFLQEVQIIKNYGVFKP